MAHVVFITNPLAPLNDAKKLQLEQGLTIRQWLEKQFPGFKEFDVPTICTVNNVPKLRRDWLTTQPGPDDVVVFTPMPGDPVTALWVIVGAVVASAVTMAFTPKLQPPTAGQNPEADPVYSLKGQRNQVRLSQPIEVVYGAPRMFPSIAAPAYNQYEGNQQWLYQLFSLGTGKFVINQMRFDDTPIGDFQDVETEIVPPGVAVTLFPTNVSTSSEIEGIELLGANEPEASGVWIEDSPGDPDADPPIPPTGHYSYTNAGPFVLNAANTTTKKIECDVTLPRGLYKTNATTGAFENQQVTALFEAQLIDNSGTPIGDWFTLFTFNKTMSTQTPQRFTLSADVDEGRYRVRAARTNNKNTDARAGNTLQWEAARAFLEGTQNFGDVTLIALKARATNNLNNDIASRFNVLGNRMLFTWDAETEEWSAEETPTRSIVWAFCDLFRAEYGGRLADTYLDLERLSELDAIFTARGWFFDWVFDQRITVWEAARLIAQAGRSSPMLIGSRITMVYDEPKTLPVAIFNPENIIKGSFRWELKLWSIDPHDGIEVTYVDPDTWKEETVLCCLPGEDGNNPEKINLQGVISRTHAYQLGMHRRAIQRHVRENIVFDTGLEGNIPTFGDLIAVSHDVPRWGKAGLVQNATGPALAGETPVARTLTLSEPVAFDGVSTYKILVRKNNGTALGPFTATAGANDREVVIQVTASTWETFYFDSLHNLPLFLFGKTDFIGKYCKVQSITPGEGETVRVVAVNYSDIPFSFDEYTPPAKGDTDGFIPRPPPAPSVVGLVVNRAPDSGNEVIATWFPVAGASYYLVQLSYDGTSWETITDSLQDTNIRFTVLPKFIYVRVAAVGQAQGPWTYWTGEAPVDRTDGTGQFDEVPDAVEDVDITEGFGTLWLTWTNPTNVKIKNIHIFYTEDLETAEEDRPLVPQFSVAGTQTFHAHEGLPDAARRNYWLQVESVGGKFSAFAGPFSGTTTNGITLDHLIPGGLQPVEIVTVLPSTGNYQGRLVYLTQNDNVGGTFTKDQIYRWTDTSTTGKTYWTRAVPAVDITGQLTNDQIASIAAAKVAGQLTNDQIAAIAAAKVTGQLVDSQLAGIAAAKIAGQLTTTQIADGAVTTAKVVAGAITAAELAAGSVIAGKIAAGAITAGTLAAGAVTAGTIAASAVTATELAAGSVVAGKIAAGAVLAGTIAAGAITATELAAGSVTTAKLAAGAVTANELAANSVIAGKIQAGAITADAIGANEIITYSANIANGVITNAKIADATIATAKIGDAQITSAKIADANVTTLKIGGNAVTVPVTEQSGASYTGNGGFQVVQSIGFTAPYDMMVFVITSQQQGYSGGTVNHTLELKMDGSIIVAGGGTAYNDYPCIAGAVYVSAGAHTVEVNWYGATSGISTGSRTTFIMGAMR